MGIFSADVLTEKRKREDSIDNDLYFNDHRLNVLFWKITGSCVRVNLLNNMLY